MIANSKTLPVITRYDDENMSVPITIEPTTVMMNDILEDLYRSDNMIVPSDPNMDVASMDWIKALLIAAIKQKHEEIIAEGYLSSFGFRVDIKQENVTDWSAALQLLQLSGAQSIEVGDYDNCTHSISSAEYAQLCGEIGLYLSSLRSYKWSVRKAIEAAETIEAAYGEASWKYPE